MVYAREFGWPPEVVDALPLAVEPWLLPINSAIEKDIADRRDKAHRDAEAKAAKNARGQR